MAMSNIQNIDLQQQKSVMSTIEAENYATVKSKGTVAFALALIIENVAIIMVLFNHPLDARVWVIFGLCLLSCIIAFIIGCISLYLSSHNPALPSSSKLGKSYNYLSIESNPQPQPIYFQQINSQGQPAGEVYIMHNFNEFKQLNLIVQYLTYVVLLVNIPIIALEAQE